jgi:hypothetical protein
LRQFALAVVLVALQGKACYDPPERVSVFWCKWDQGIIHCFQKQFCSHLVTYIVFISLLCLGRNVSCPDFLRFSSEWFDICMSNDQLDFDFCQTGPWLACLFLWRGLHIMASQFRLRLDSGAKDWGDIGKLAWAQCSCAHRCLCCRGQHRLEMQSWCTNLGFSLAHPRLPPCFWMTQIWIRDWLKDAESPGKWNGKRTEAQD